MNRIREFTPRIPAAAIEGMATGGGSTAWNDVTGKPSTFPPATHSHDYAASVHSHAISSVTGLEAALDGKLTQDEADTLYAPIGSGGGGGMTQPQILARGLGA